jgi:4,5-DOPA dioxygenase extradiol
VHNLHAYAWGKHTVEPYQWTVAFEKRVRELLLAAETNPLID